MHRSSRITHTVRFVIAASIIVLLSSCSQGKDKVVDLDLRQPTSPRQLKSRSADGYSITADRRRVLNVTLRLPDATVTGRFVVLNSNTVAGVNDADSPLNNVVLFDPDVETFVEVKAIVEDFEREWGIHPDSIADRDNFFRKALGFIDQDGKPKSTGDGVDTNFVFGIRGIQRGTLEPSLTIRPSTGIFSTYRSFRWDPLAKSAGTGS